MNLFLSYSNSRYDLNCSKFEWLDLSILLPNMLVFSPSESYFLHDDPFTVKIRHFLLPSVVDVIHNSAFYYR